MLLVVFAEEQEWVGASRERRVEVVGERQKTGPLWQPSHSKKNECLNSLLFTASGQLAKRQRGLQTGVAGVGSSSDLFSRRWRGREKRSAVARWCNLKGRDTLKLRQKIAKIPEGETLEPDPLNVVAQCMEVDKKVLVMMFDLRVEAAVPPQQKGGPPAGTARRA